MLVKTHFVVTTHFCIKQIKQLKQVKHFVTNINSFIDISQRIHSYML